MRSVELFDAAFRAAATPYQTYTPTMTAVTTNPTGQTVVGRYRRVGTWAHLTGVATMGAGLGTGEYRISMPTGWVAATQAGMYWEGGGVIIDTSAAVGYAIRPMVASAATLIRLVWANGAAAQQPVQAAVNFPIPTGFASTDTIAWAVTLELAP